ncbi:MAG: hypothetical protein CSA65_09050 [Proteobacteria bacterium]|nr:MAG: hypothetical protein CSA65_09050 [Pseudomonadota bacterium]
MYRDHLYAARCRQQQLSREGSSEAAPPELIRVYARRVARIWGASFGLAGLLAMVFHFLVTMNERALSLYIVGAWLAMGVAYLAVRLLAPTLLRWRLRRAYATSGDIFFDLGRLEDQTPRDFALATAHRYERLGFQLPLVALALLAPLSIHLGVALAFLGLSISGFGTWILTSAALVGHAHLTLALFAVFHVVRVQRELDTGTRVTGASRGLIALLWTVGASAIPGVVLLCVPPLLVALTGLLFVPWAFHWVGAAAQAERATLVDLGLVVESPSASANGSCFRELRSCGLVGEREASAPDQNLTA